jgi:hypothetical protein
MSHHADRITSLLSPVIFLVSRNAAAAAGTLHPRRNASGKAARVLLISLKLKVETF